MHKKGPLQRYKAQRALEQNDKCFFCHIRMGEDVTAEHLHPKSRGGRNDYANIRAAHARCNVLVGVLPYEEKLRLHWIGREEGSDAFFLEAARLDERRLAKSRKKSDKRRLRHARLRQTGATALARQRLEKPSDAPSSTETPGGVLPPGPAC
jgi:hypothetical protein